jgi:thiamine-phosphate pyrophosphorylase
MKRDVVAVYPVIDLQHAGPHPEVLVAAALRAGATILQLRDKRDSTTHLTELATRIRPWLEAAGVPLIINDRVGLAVDLKAAGVHVGQHDLSASEARSLATARGCAHLIVGVSITSAEQATTALAGGADYLSVSPVFGTPTKADIDKPAGLDGVRAIRAVAPKTPIVAIGGIKAAHVRSLVEAGADGVAFISAFSSGRHPEHALRAMAAAVADAKHCLVGTTTERKAP